MQCSREQAHGRAPAWPVAAKGVAEVGSQADEHSGCWPGRLLWSPAGTPTCDSHHLAATLQQLHQVVLVRGGAAGQDLQQQIQKL